MGLSELALSRELTQSSYPAIGRLFHDRHHTTTRNAVRRDRELLHRDANFAVMLPGRTGEVGLVKSSCLN